METGIQIQDDVFNRLEKVNGIFIDMLFDKNMTGPSNIVIEEKTYFRFMDFFYLNKPVHRLSLTEIVQVCELRLQYLDKVLDKRLNSHIVRSMTNYVYSYFNHHATSHIAALDFGCGSGLSLNLILNNLPNIELIGLDISHKAVQLASQTGVLVKHHKAGSRLPYKDSQLDLVFAVFVMHFQVGHSTISEIYRILNDRGIFIFNVYNIEPPNLRLFLAKSGFKAPKSIPPYDIPCNHKIYVCTKK